MARTTRKVAFGSVFGIALFAGSVALAETNVCEGEWDLTVGQDQIHLVLDAEAEAFTGSAELARLNEEFSIWGFCSLSDGNAAVTWHSDIPTPSGSVYLDFDGVMSNFVYVKGIAKDIEGNEVAFIATKVVH